MKKENIYLDLSKCTEEQIKHLRQIDPLIDKIEIFPYLFLDETEWNQTRLKGITGENKTELTYPEFIKLFEGEEGENQTYAKEDIERLKSDKAELLEALEDCKERLENMNKRLIEVDGYSRLSVYFASKLNSLIQKMKQ